MEVVLWFPTWPHRVSVQPVVSLLVTWLKIIKLVMVALFRWPVLRMLFAILLVVNRLGTMALLLPSILAVSPTAMLFTARRILVAIPTVQQGLPPSGPVKSA